jgi:hypothetical protein
MTSIALSDFCYFSLQIVWRNFAENDVIFIISVDGVHCRINEPRTQPNSQWCSHKSKSAGLAYELAVSIFDGKLVWVNGPFPAGQNDIQMYRKDDGLKSKIPAGKRVIADQGYLGEAQITTRNSQDSPAVKAFKRRVKARQETFNSRIKNFRRGLSTIILVVTHVIVASPFTINCS